MRGRRPTAAKSRTMWSAFLATRSQGRRIHSPPRSTAANFVGQLLEPALDAAQIQALCRSGPTQAQAGSPSQSPTQGNRIAAAMKPGGGTHRELTTSTGPLSEPVAIVDDDARVTLLLDSGQGRSHDHSTLQIAGHDAEGATHDVAQRLASQEQFEGGSGQGQRCQFGDGIVFHEANSHESPIPRQDSLGRGCRSLPRAIGLRGLGFLRDEMIGVPSSNFQCRLLTPGAGA